MNKDNVDGEGETLLDVNEALYALQRHEHVSWNQQLHNLNKQPTLIIFECKIDQCYTKIAAQNQHVRPIMCKDYNSNSKGDGESHSVS